MTTPFEAVGDVKDWPRNEPNKSSQAAVFGVYHPKKGMRWEILWTGKFPELQPALYWAAKKEMEAVRKGKWLMASRVVWQHDLTPEQAVATVRKQMEPQVDRALGQYRGGRDIDIGSGPMRTVGPDEDVPRLVEILPPGGDGDPLASFVIPPKDPLARRQHGGGPPAG
jgi:hypothetical protein